MIVLENVFDFYSDQLRRGSVSLDHVCDITDYDMIISSVIYRDNVCMKIDLLSEIGAISFKKQLITMCFLETLEIFFLLSISRNFLKFDTETIHYALLYLLSVLSVTSWR